MNRAAGTLFAACVFAAATGLAQQPEPATGFQPKQAVVAKQFMVAAANPLAVDAGVAILRAGGSALDAAIAVQLVLGLVEPQSSGIGGGAFLVHWSEKERRVRSYDGRETAPAAARESRFLDSRGKPLGFEDAVVSGAAVGVPGVLRMLELAHRHHGSLPWARLFGPAIRLAEEGFAISPRLHALLARDPFLRRDPQARALYYDAATDLAKPAGARLANSQYAAVLKAIAAGGADVFHAGPIARDIVRAVRSHARPGDIAEGDLRGYRALERGPVCAPYRAHRLCGMGPPSSGAVTLFQMLAILERTPFARAPADSAEALHLFSEAGRLAYADRARYLADPDFVPQPVAGLLDAAYLDARAARIGERSMGEAEAGVPRGAQAHADAPEAGRPGTSHVSIVDRDGNALAMTTSIENAFGSRIMVRGFLLNNQLTDFSFLPQVDGRPVANRVEPGKRPRSSMAPTLVFDPSGALRMTLGSPGGPPIILYVAKALVGVLDWGLDIQAAISLPNAGSLNGPTLIERGSAWEALAAPLVARGHEVRTFELTSGLQGIERTPDGWRGGADPRREGAAAGD